MELPNHAEVVWGEWKAAPTDGLNYRIGVKAFVDPSEPNMVNQYVYLQTKHKEDER